MIKRTLVLMVAFAILHLANAQQVSMNEALRRAQCFMPEKTFLTHHNSRKVGDFESNPTSAPYYIFNAMEEGGFVIVSGDDRTEVILGYSDTGYFDTERIPKNVKCWLDGYKKAINHLQHQGDTIKKVEANSDKQTVPPLLKTQWNQRTPYNKKCPLVDGIQCVTGCVATAMAQIMKYYNYPTSSKTTYQYRTLTNKIIMKALPVTDFAWEKMLDKYYNNGSYTEEEIDAVATLMLYCGCALSMDYAVDESGADVTPVCDAMEYFFGYDGSIKKVYRDSYNAETWEELIYNEIAKGCPVFYSGRTEESGHAFICDGYDKGFFHINWGWGGSYDGHFKLSVLYPYTDSYDENEYEDGYVSEQMAVINIKPKDFHGFDTSIYNLNYCCPIKIGID